MSTSDPLSGLIPLAEARELTADEWKLIDVLFSVDFPGREELRKQLRESRVSAEGRGNERTLLFAFPTDVAPVEGPVSLPIPIEGWLSDDDDLKIEVLLHVHDGRARELEIYRVDGESILRERITHLDYILVHKHDDSVRLERPAHER